MPKTYIRSLWGDETISLWKTDQERAALQEYLNDLGFYVLNGAGGSLEVYALEYYEPYDVRLAKKCLDKIQKSWHTLSNGGN